MPKLSDEPLHRLHVMIPIADKEWLEQNLEPGQLSGLFRNVIKRLRGQKILEPQLSVMEILNREELSL